MKNIKTIPEIFQNTQPRPMSSTRIESHEIVHPADTNALDKAFGGFLMSLMDKTACIVAFQHVGRIVNTLSIDGVRFFKPAEIGTILNIHASLNRAFNTSMEIGVKISETDERTNTETTLVHAYFTFVALDDHGKPTAVPQVYPETEDEKRRFEQALIRRNARIELQKKL